MKFTAKSAKTAEAVICRSYRANCLLLVALASLAFFAVRKLFAHQSKNNPSTGDEAEAKRLAGMRPAR